MVKSIFFAGIAAIGNAVFVYGQRGSGQSNNPSVFIAMGSIRHNCDAYLHIPDEGEQSIHLNPAADAWLFWK